MKAGTGAGDSGLGSEASVLVRRWRDGDDDARDVLIARMLPQLQVLAERALRRLDQPVSLHPSDLAQETVVRLLRSGGNSVDSSHLRALAGDIVWKVLIDYQRVRLADKRGRRDTVNVSITVMNKVMGDGMTQIDLLALHQAMEKLETISARAARIVIMRVYGGLSEQEVVDVLGISRPTVSRDWATAKLWLARELSSTSHGGMEGSHMQPPRAPQEEAP